MRFESYGSGVAGGVVIDSSGETNAEMKPFPDHFIELSEDKENELSAWLDQHIETLINSQQENQTRWDAYETAYRAYPEPPKTEPFIGASNLVVPVIAMAVDPIYARLDTGIWKQDPPFTLKALRKAVQPYIASVQKFVNYWAINVAKLRNVASPRTLECVKLGTMVFKTVYDREQYKIKTYDPKNKYKVIDRTEVRYSGPRVLGVSLGDILFPAGYQHLQDCPIVIERQRTSYWKLKIAEQSGRLRNCDKVKDQLTRERTQLEESRQAAAGHQDNTVASTGNDDGVVYEIYCDYDINGDNIPEHLVITYHRPTRTYLQRRFNWYFNQKKPYVVIPYGVTSESLYGIGLAEMVLPFQQAITKWEQMAQDNAYIANIRMFIVKINSDIEEVPRLYTGRCFFVSDPRNDFIPFAMGDIYPSTLSERQNLFGLVEKRTGVSDYLTGRESPVLGSRATATSTIALIQEGTKRVEQVLENLREGFSEILMNCISIWVQYGLEGLDEMVLGDDKVTQDVQAFFDEITEGSLHGTIGIDLTATDASGSRSAMQSMQLQLIQIMMGYYEKVLEAMTAASQAQQQQLPEVVDVIKEVAIAARKLFIELLNNYQIRNPEDYVPDLTKYISGGTPQGPTADGGRNGGPDIAGRAGDFASLPGMGQALAAIQRTAEPRPALPGSGNEPGPIIPTPGNGNGSTPMYQ
jgi:hypothetical protein